MNSFFLARLTRLAFEFATRRHYPSMMRKCVIAGVLMVLLLVTIRVSVHQASYVSTKLSLRSGLSPSERVTVDLNHISLPQALVMYSELTGRTQLPKHSSLSQDVDEFFGGYLSRWRLVKAPPRTCSGIEYHRDGLFSVSEVKEHLEEQFASVGLVPVPEGNKYFRIIHPSKMGDRWLK
jgi:hypothetical protein